MPKKIDWNATILKLNEVKKSGTPRNKIDERFYTPKVKEDGTYEAIIRFLPAPDDDVDLPFVLVYNHFFTGEDGQVYSELCPTTIGEKCPVCKANNKSWEAGDQDAARNRARKMKGFVNILVVKDPACRENEGKVFLFKFDKKMYTKINEKINPPKDSIDEPVYVFDWWEGCNFKLKIRQKTFTNSSGKKISFSDMEASEFVGVTTPVGSDEYMDSVEKMLFPLKPFVDPSEFHSYDDLDTKFRTVMGVDVPRGRAASTTSSRAVVDSIEEEPRRTSVSSSEASKPAAKPVQTAPEASDSDDDDEDGFFANLGKAGR